MSEAASSPPASPLDPALYERSLDCVHCGLCLTSCPTYRVTGRETSSPRGRIYLMRGVAEGRIPLGETLAEEAFLCLGCRACETACPSGVEYGAMLEDTRAAVQAAGLRPGLGPRLEGFLLRQLVPRRWRLRAAMGSLALAQRLRLDRMAFAVGPRRWRALRGLTPEVPRRRERRRLPTSTPGEGETRGRVAFLEGCVMPELFGSINHASVRVLARNGFDVHAPKAQTCCGALQAHAGDLDTARRLARKNVEVFAALEVEALLSNSAGCGAALLETRRWLGLGEGAAPLAPRVCDVLSFLDQAGLRPPRQSLPLRVCYDDPCHLIHGQGVGEAPRRLLQQIPELELVPHSDPGSCCGAAGTYNLTHPEMSEQVLDRKLDALAEANPDVIATGNPGCILQLRSGVKRRGLRAEVLHPLELLDRAYGNPVPN